MDASSSSSGLPLHLIITGAATLFFGIALSIVLFKSKQSKDINKDDVPEVGTISCENSTETSTSEQTKDAYPGGQFLIFYGSQTGTAESFATSMANEATTHGFKAKALDLEDVTEDGPENLQSMMRDCGRALFLVSTYGEGEPTTSAATMVDFMKKKLGGEESGGEEIDGEWMKGVDYAVFGLGNTEYEYYNAMGKFFDSSLEKLGGNRVLELGLGDDNDDLEGDFENWKGLLWTAFTERYIGTKEPTVVEVKEDVCDAKFTLEYLPEQESPSSSDSKNLFSHDDIHTSAKHYFDYETLTVKTNNELLTPSPKYPHSSTRHIELTLPPHLSYHTADNLAILPINATSTVTAVANALNYSLDATFKLTPRDTTKKHSHPFPTPCTVRTFLERYCDLTTPPRRSELKELARFASDPLDRAALLRLSDKDGRKEYKEKILEAHVGLVDIITQLTPSVKVPLEHFVEICAKLQPRHYTIASSSSVFGSEVHLTLAVVKEERKDGSMFEGVCSNYLKSLKDGDSVRAFIQPSTFRLPENPSTPIIMIGPGTGIAPMRAMIQERSHQKHALKQPVGPTILYFGCKHATIDYIYKNELTSFQKEGTLTECHLAFSRDGAEKQYVQHLLAKNTTDTWNLIDNEGAYIYVCGGIKMGHDVVGALKTIIMKSKGATLDEATEYCQKLHHDKRLVQELWA